MANVEIKKAWDGLGNVKWEIHDSYGQSYLTPEEFAKQTNNLSILRRLKGISHDHRYALNILFKSGQRHYNELKEYLYNAPRREAQKFIGKKNIREFIFKRDGYKCLKCSDNDSLSIDHIVPVKAKLINKLSNLQTLCMRCNIIKSGTIADYREGAR